MNIYWKDLFLDLYQSSTLQKYRSHLIPPNDAEAFSNFMV